MANKSETTLILKRTFNAPREKVFQAWTNPEMLKEWFHGGDDWTTPIQEVDLQVGGKFRLGMQPPDAEAPYVAYGTYREVQPPEKLVYTWDWEGQDPLDTLVTVVFREVGDSTEVELTHERFPNPETRDQHREGWIGCMDQLDKSFLS
ncbi:MAG: SRPBCC domain-containing protein [bacterium]